MKLEPPPVRQPPPPRRSRKRNEEEEEEEEEEENSKGKGKIYPANVKNVGSRTYYLRRCKRANFVKSNINSLPEELVFDILLHLPAQDVYGAARPVCLKWYQMIHTHRFLDAHLHRSTYGLLIRYRASLPSPVQLTFMQLRKGQIELTRLNYEPKCDISCSSSCNGLILESEHEKKNHDALYITNPATMQRFALPPLFLCWKAFGFSAIAYASLSMKYKVVRTYYQFKEKQRYCAILTAGVDDSWRHVRTQHLSLEARKLLTLTLTPLTTEGFVHWAGRGSCVLTLNVETEIITEYRVPSLCYGDRFGYTYLYFSTVKCISLLIPCRLSSWEVWEMKPETGEWTKLPGIDLKDRMCEINGLLYEGDRIIKSVRNCGYVLAPVGWLEYKEVLVCRVSFLLVTEEPRFCIAWNIRSKEITLIEVDPNWNDFLVHRNSLVWLDGC